MSQSKRNKANRFQDDLTNTNTLVAPLGRPGNGKATRQARARVDESPLPTEGDGAPPASAAESPRTYNDLVLVGGRKLTFTPVRRAAMRVRLKGVTPLLTHRMSKRAEDRIEAQFTGKPVSDEHRSPLLEYREAQYLAYDAHPQLIDAYVPDFDEQIKAVGGKRDKADGDVHAFPVVAVFRAMERACKFIKGVSMADAPSLFTVMNDDNEFRVPELSVLHYDTVQMRRDRVRMAKGNGTTLAYRSMYTDWSLSVMVEFNSEIITADSVLTILQRSGDGGIGAWRPQCRGVFGRYAIDPDSLLLFEPRNGAVPDIKLRK